MAEGVYLAFKNGDRFKIKFRHNDMRQVVEQTKRSIGDLLDDQFGGWPYLLMAGLRQQHPRITVTDASNYIDQLIGEGMPMRDIGMKLVDAAVAAGYIELERPEKPEKPEKPESAEEPDPNGSRPTTEH